MKTLHEQAVKILEYIEDYQEQICNNNISLKHYPGQIHSSRTYLENRNEICKMCIARYEQRYVKIMSILLVDFINKKN